MSVENEPPKKGLEGVVVDVTTISKVMPEINALVYRGYPVQELADHCSFEEIAWLLWHADLPTREQLDELTRLERSQRALSDGLLASIRLFPKTAHPMDAIRTAVSFLGMEDPDVWKSDRETNLCKSLNLLAKIPTAIAAFSRHRKGQPPIAPRTDLGVSENFFYMNFGEVPAPEIVKALDASLVLYAEHSFNASTFTARVVTSSLSDLYSAITAAIGSLKGPLHGGANEQVMHMLREIGDPSRARDWVLETLRAKRKIMGFGHRVYRKGDSRAPTMKRYGLKLAELKGDRKWYEISAIVEQTMIEQKNIHPNLDFPAGPAYDLMGFEVDLFTPIFVMSRITGWSAHVMEQNADNRLIRPLSQYTGHPERRVVPMADR